MSDHYTNVTATTQPTNGNLTWFAALTKTSDNSSIPNTAFSFNITTSSNSTGIQSVKWNVTIPSPGRSCPSCTHTVVRFTVINSTLITGTNATYAFLKNVTTVFGPNSLANRTTNIPSSMMGTVCPETRQICFEASGHVNSTLTLHFLFGWNLTGTGLKIMKVEIGKLLVFSTNLSFTNSDSHTMALTSSTVAHSANVTLSYNRTITAGARHNWNSSIITIYYPTAYQLDRLVNITAIFYPASSATVPDRYPFETGSCQAPNCTAIFPTSFVSLNMTDDRSVARILTVLATTPNAVTSIATEIRGAATNFWMPGDTATVKMRSEPRVNASGSQTISLTPPVGVPPPNQTFTNRGGTYSYEVTIPETAPLGKWNVTGVFLNGYDFGQFDHTIWVDEIKASSIEMSGAVGQGATLTVRGALAYKHNTTTLARDVNVTVFAIDAGSLPGPIASTGTGSVGLYISNITFVRGVFNQAQPLIVFFTVVNPTPSTAYNATLTIEHEWYSGSGGSHGSTITFPLTLGDEPFTLNSSSVYRMDVTLTSNGARATVKSITTPSGTEARTFSPGSSGVSNSRQHFGSFKIIIDSIPTRGGSPSSNSLRSPTYAYVIDSSLIPSRLMDFSSTVATLPNGTFSATIKGDKLLGANRLVVFALARDQNGITIGRGQVGTDSDSTFLTPDAKIPSEVTIRQSVTVTLNLKSNSSLPVTLTVNVDVFGSAAFGTKTVTIQPGSTLPIDFTITAPDTAGSYLLTFSSPQYGVIATKELKVSLLQSSLQVLIPAIIGLVSALVILGLYLIRKRGGTEIVEEEKKRPAPGKPSKPTQGPSGSKSLTRS